MKNKNLGLFFSVIIAGFLALGAPVLAEDVNSTADVGNSAPVVYEFHETPLGSSAVLSPFEMNNTFDYNCSYSDSNGVSDINKSASNVYYDNYPGEFTKTFEELGAVYDQINSTHEVATFTVYNIPYYRDDSDYGNPGIECEVIDKSSASNKQGHLVSIQDLTASSVNVSSVDFGSLGPGDTGTSETFKVENGGNVLLNSSWEGTDYSGPSSLLVTNADIDSSSFGVLGLQTIPQYYGQIEVETDGAGNPSRLYEPYFSLAIPLGTPAGSYSNIMTHTVTQA